MASGQTLHVGSSQDERSSLTIRQRVGYGMGDAGACLCQAVISMFATRYYVNVLKIDGAVLATLLLIWNVWDAINDPLMGAIMDKVFARHHDPRGKFRPWLLRAAPGLALSCIAFFFVPTWLDGFAMIAALFLCKVLGEGFYTMFNIPMGSLLSAMSTNDVERAQLSSARGFGSVASSMLPAIFLPQILAYFGENNAIAYQVGTVICATIGLVLCLLHYRWTSERNADALNTSGKSDSIKLTDILMVFRKNRPFVALCLYSVLIMTSGMVMANFGTYMYADVLGDIGMMSLSSFITLPLQLLALAIAPKIAQRFSLVKIARVCLMASVVCYAAIFCLQTFAGLPPLAFLIAVSFASALSDMSMQMQWGMVGEAIDYNEYLTGKRTEGSIYGTFSLSRRIGTTLASSLAVLMLGWVGYDASLAVQAPATLEGITMVYLLVPAACALLCWVCFRFIWNLTPEVREKMRAHLEAQKSQRA